jgi:hypothetical protein
MACLNGFAAQAVIIVFNLKKGLVITFSKNLRKSA